MAALEKGIKGSIQLRRPRVVAAEVNNLTRQLLYVYGTSGDLARLDPEPLTEDTDVSKLSLEDNVYYVVDKRAEKLLTEMGVYEEFRTHLVRVLYVGEGRNGMGIFRLKNLRDIEIVPMTENFGLVGALIW